MEHIVATVTLTKPVEAFQKELKWQYDDNT